MRRGRDLLFEALQAQGVRYVFGNPGTTELPILDGFTNHPSVQYVEALHEDIAVGMAMGYARLAGNLGVVNLHVAPGLAHGLGNLYSAWSARIPLLVTAGQQHTRLLIQEPILTADLVGMARPFTKWAYEVRSANELPSVFQRAFKEALAPPSGPVFLSLPADVMLGELGDEVPPPRLTAQPAPATRGDDAEIARAAARLVGAERPLIVAGDGVGLADAWAEVGAIAERLGAAVYTEGFSTLCNFPPTHPHWAGTLPDAPEAMRQVFAEIDVALMCGFSSQAAVAIFDAGGPLIPWSVDVVAVHDNPWEIAKNGPVLAGILGDVRLNLRALLSALKATSQPRGAGGGANRRRAELGRQAAERRAAWTDQATQASQQDGLTATAVAAALAEVMPPTAILADESVSNRAPFLNLLNYQSPRSFWSAKGGGLGSSGGAALGMRLAAPERPVVNVVGDGAFLYYPQVLWTAANLALGSTVFVVLNNASYRVLKLGLERMGGPWAGAQPPGLDIQNPCVDLAALARSFGLDAERLTRPDQLRPALERALSAPGPVLLECVLAAG
jgi:benzoylformate decarboxylase